VALGAYELYGDRVWVTAEVPNTSAVAITVWRLRLGHGPPFGQDPWEREAYGAARTWNKLVVEAQALTTAAAAAEGAPPEPLPGLEGEAFLFMPMRGWA
jgi:hypothetical protein